METESKRRARQGHIQQLVLGTVAAAGILSVGLLAPNVLGAMAKMGLLPSLRQGEVIKNARKRLVRKGLLEYRNGKLRLTKAGEREVAFIEAGKRRTRRRWDKRWRMVIFDIPERRRATRRRLGVMLRSAGFLLIQDSVWIYPYNCEDLLVLIKAELKVGADVLYCIVDMIENDGAYRKHFKLPPP